MILTILIILIVGLLIALITRIVVSYNQDKTIDNFTANDFIDLKSGDLVFVSYKNLLGQSIRALSASQWSHIGMIYKEKNEIFILEVADYNLTYSGVIKIPYKNWLNLNKNHDIFIRKLQTESYLDLQIQENILNEFSKLQKYKQQKMTDILELHRLMFFEVYDEQKLEKLEKITCIELVVLMLQNLNLMPKDYMPASFYPCDLASNQFLNSYDTIKKLN